MSYYSITALIMIIPTLVIHAYSCITGTHEQCLYSRGLIIVYWAMLYIFFGIPLAWYLNVKEKERQKNNTPEEK